ncbi:hypothetical protein BC751_2809 [Cecembia calidifontis]|jgi:hypothetical protein|uniref:Uncharacterized protein n=1 Tax=Cecembia calidifontis TaxID=1187080 RepID=A0A4V2F6R2_9BACT|nr:hypothetical protein BC751_2809 [Cecembia calidifontis]
MDLEYLEKQLGINSKTYWAYKLKGKKFIILNDNALKKMVCNTDNFDYF